VGGLEGRVQRLEERSGERRLAEARERVGGESGWLFVVTRREAERDGESLYFFETVDDAEEVDGE